MIRKTLTPLASARMQKAMQEKPCSIDELVVVSDLSKPLVRRYVKELYTADPKMIHVGGWDRDSRGYPTIRLFSWGYGDDVECPKMNRTAAERMRELRATRRKAA